MRRKFLLPAAAAAALLGVAVITRGAWLGSVRHLPGFDHTPVRELARLNPRRSFAPRLSIDTGYRECRGVALPADSTVPREDCGRPDGAPVEVLALRAGQDYFTPDSLQASALARVMWGQQDEATLNEAIARLERAVRLSLERVPLLVDLSAAYLVRAERTQKPMDLTRGLEFAREALEYDSRNAAALFNAALARQALALEGEAARAWDAYLAVDSTSPWAEEARARKRGLITRYQAPPEPRPDAPDAEVDAFARSYPQEARLLGWGRVLGEWGAAVEAGDTARAASWLALAQRLGYALERRKGGDASLADAVRAIRAASAGPSATVTLARAHRDYARGQREFRVRNDSARAAFSRVLTWRPPSPILLQWAEAHVVALSTFTDVREAQSASEGLLPRIDSARYPALAGRVRWTLATSLFRESKYKQTSDEYRTAASYFARAGEIEHMGAMLAYGGEALHRLGDTLAAYQSLQRATQMLRPYRRSVLLHNHLLTMSILAGLDEMARASAAIVEEDVAIARGLGGVGAVEALIGRAGARVVAGDSAGALRDLDLAGHTARQITDTTARHFATMLGFSRAVIGGGSSDSNPAASIDSAVDYFTRRNKNVLWLIPALTRRASVRMATNDVAGAIEDLDSVTAHVLRLSNDSREARLRGAMVEQARSRFDQLVMLYVEAERPNEALRALERGRLSFRTRPEGTSRQPGGWLAALPAGQVALEYALIGDTLLTWAVDRDSMRLVRQRVHRDTFLLVVERTIAALESPERDGAADSDLRLLYDWLIRPVQGYLGKAETPLVIVADGEVAAVPFPALRDGGTYLIERHPLRLAATLSDAARPPVADPGGRALLVANPAFSRQSSRLPRLPGAAQEVQDLLRFFTDTVVLREAEATREAWLKEAPSARVIHYAGHAVFDDARPERSYLLLAGADTAARLTAEALESLDLRGVRLVVLSACETLPSRAGRSGGFAGLSGALLQAGVGGTVGSLWRVSDHLTKPLMVEFHRSYRAHGDPARALRDAQLRMLQSDTAAYRNPAAWAAFRYAGN